MPIEPGADAIKTEYTGDPETMVGVIEGCPTPCSPLAARRAAPKRKWWRLPSITIEGRARWINFGRNIPQADDPENVGARREVCTYLREEVSL